MNMKKVFFLFLTILWLGYVNGFAYAQELTGKPSPFMKELGKIAAIIAKNKFHDEELLVPKSIFEEAGYEVTIFSSSLGKAKGMLGAVVSVDNVITELNPKEYDAVIFVGGVGSSEYWDNERAHQVARDTLANHRVLAAICIAPVTLAKAGVLNGKQATVWSSEKAKLKREGAIYTGAGVEVSGNIVTANGPRSAREFAEAILGLLK